MLNNEIAIPFGAFAPDRDGAEDIDVLVDEIDGTIAAGEPGRSAAARAVPPPRAAAGRVVVAVAVPDPGSLSAADQLVDRLLDRLGDFEAIAPGIHRGRHEHHDPGDLAYWAEVDAARGHLATSLDILVCTHHLGSSRRTYVVTVEGPSHLLGVLVSAAEATSDGTRWALLTSAGTFTTEPSGSVVVLAAANHAHHLGGRAEVFPGQEWLIDDLPVSSVLERTAIDEVRSTQGPFAPGATLRAYGFVRPNYDDGALVLTVGHDDPLVVTPWEVRYCRPCCG